MDASGSSEANQAYYDAFSEGYERIRGSKAPGGYHDLLDSLESELVARYGRDGHVLEVGCGTGLVLERIAGFAKNAQGVDLSPGMLKLAEDRGLNVRQGSATELPFDDNSFDVTCSFKVLAHVPNINQALSEMARVTRPGGHILAEFYNPHSFRGLIKRFGPALSIAKGANEADVFTRFDRPKDAAAMVPEGCEFVAARGVRITLFAGALMKVPGLRRALWNLEHALCDTQASQFAGFWVGVYKKV